MNIDIDKNATACACPCVVYMVLNYYHDGGNSSCRIATKVVRGEHEPSFNIQGLVFNESDACVRLDKENPGQYIVEIDGKLERLKKIEMEDLN